MTGLICEEGSFANLKELNRKSIDAQKMRKKSKHNAKESHKITREKAIEEKATGL